MNPKLVGVSPLARTIPIDLSPGLVNRFWAKVERGGLDDCWRWKGAKQSAGYGVMSAEGKGNGSYYAHRVAYTIEHGPIPAGMAVCHRCDNPPCCNTAHHFLGTLQENAQDMASKGRGAKGASPPIMRGEANPRALLTEEAVRAIRILGRNGFSSSRLGALFTIDDSQIRRILRGENWPNRNLEGTPPMQTRRDALKQGGRIIATAAVLPLIPSIAHAKEDAELFALYDEYRLLEKQYEAAMAKASKAAFAVRDAFRDPPTLTSLQDQITTELAPQWEAVIDSRDEVLRLKSRRLAKAIGDIYKSAKEQWHADLAEAEKQAGVPPLKKKQDTACTAWSDALQRFMDTRAKTPAGMILKFHIAWCDKQRQHWEAHHFHGGVEFWDDAMASVLMDLERLAGRAI